MRLSKAGNAIVTAGAVVGVAGISAMAIGYVPTLTPGMVELLFYKVVGASAFGLMLVGTWIGRTARRLEAEAARRPLELDESRELDESLHAKNRQDTSNELEVRR